MDSRIALLCNMNHMMFTLCRYLRDRGYNCHLFIFKDEAKHFMPEADSYNQSYKSYTTILNHTKEDFFSDDLSITIKLLQEYNFFIGTDLAPAFLLACGIRLDIFVPHGTDVFKIPFDHRKKKPKVVNSTWWNNSLLFNSTLQFLGINETNYIIVDDEYNRFNYKQELSLNIKYISLTPPMLYADQYQNMKDIEKLKFANQFLKIREENDLIVFSQSRHFWVNQNWMQKSNGKGNDVLIIGFAKFIKEFTQIKSMLILYEYGVDVDASKKLIQSLEIEKNVTWFPVSDRKEIMFGLSLCDIACGEFFRSWFFCGAVNEALFLNKPLLHYRDDEGQIRENAYSILNVRNELDIYNHIKNYYLNSSQIVSDSSNGKLWMLQNCVEPMLVTLEKAIKEKEHNRHHSTISTSRVKKLKRQLKLKNFINKILRTA